MNQQRSTFEIDENELAAKIGVDRRRIADTRRETLTSGKDFIRVARGRISYSEEGAARLMAALGLPSDATSILTKNNGACQEQARETATLIVVCLTRNRRILMAREKTAGKNSPMLRLVVPRSDFFWPGMEVPGCRRDRTSIGLWRYQGRCPRKRGKW